MRRDDFTLEVRVVTLENGLAEILRIQNQHTLNITQLLIQDHDLKLEISTMSGDLRALKENIGLGFKGLNAAAKFMGSCLAGLTIVIGLFWSYSDRLDTRYAPKIDSIVKSSQAQSLSQNEVSKKLTDATQTINESNAIKEDVETIKRKKVIRSSK
jgi:hypothetical protein